MIIIPELETIVLQPPRTGTTSVKYALLEKYPNAFMLYRHMEMSGIPTGYEHWRTVVQVRNPFARMESMFKYMVNPELRGDTDPIWLKNVKAATEHGFEHWLLHDSYVFANPQPSEAKRFRPKYQVNHAWREQIKSLKLWAHGADELIFFEDLVSDCKERLEIDLTTRHQHGKTEYVDLTWTPAMIRHMNKWHSWDMHLYGVARIEEQIADESEEHF